MAGPLEGLRVIDLTQVISGPWATMLLADQGADVVKVEPVVGGEVLRPVPNFGKGGVNAYIANCNRGKSSLAVDLRDPRGVDVVRRLVAAADVFVQNFRPGAADRLGLGSDELRAEHPRLVTCSITGFGPDGPWAARPVYDPVIQAMSGHASVQVNPDIPFPDLVRTAVVDKATSLTAAQAIMAALFARDRTGEGQHVEVSMLDASVAFFWPDGMVRDTLLDDDVVPGPTLFELYRLTRCSDGHVVYWAGSAADLVALMKAVGHPEWLEDDRWATQEARMSGDNLVQLGTAIAEAFETLTVAEAVEALQAHDVAVGPVLSRHDMLDHEQIVHNGRVVEWEHPTAGRIRQVLPAAAFSATPTEVRLHVGRLGEDTDAVLADIGCSEAEVATLRAAGVVG